MEFRTKREAEEAATNLDARRPALERKRRDAQVRGDMTSAMEWGATIAADEVEAARIRALLPTLPDDNAEQRCPKHHLTLLLGACQQCESEAEGLWVGRKTPPEDVAN